MQNEPGDEYIRRIATFIRSNERNLAELGFVRRRSPRRPAETNGSAFYNPLTWFGSESTGPPPKSVVMSIDTHHLFYLLIRLEALNLPVGTLDVRIDSPSRPLSYINFFPDADKTETLSLSSFRSSFSAVSALSLGVGWWGRPEPLSVDAELKYIYSSFTKLPALSVTAPTRKLIAELANEPPNENAIPMDSFKNLQSLECTDIDPRSLLGWDYLAESLISLRIKKSGLEDVSDIFIGAVLDDQARRAGSASRKRMRRIPRGPERHTSFYSSQLPDTVPESADEETNHSPTNTMPPSELPSRKWASLRYLSLSGNDFTFFPPDLTPHLTSITHLDLSSNLLNSVPEGLSALYNLVSLNLSDNMVESVLGIYLQLGSVTFINLSRNRLESICGLERLHALERVDLRHNAIEESAEISRLAPLPNISHVWVQGNPFTEYEENYRVKCFDFFWKEGKTVMLDGSPPGFYEKRNLTASPPEQTPASRPAAHSPPTIAIGHTHPHPHPHPHTSSPPPAEGVDDDKHTSAAPSLPPSSTTSPQLGPVGAVGVGGKARKKKVKRIVDLDGDNGSDDTASVKDSIHKRTTSNGSSAKKYKPLNKTQKDRGINPSRPVDHPSFGQFISLLATPHHLPPTTTSTTNTTEQSDALTSTAVTQSDPSTSSKPSPPPLARVGTDIRPGTISSRTNHRPRHTRYQTELASPSANDSDDSSPTLKPTNGHRSDSSPRTPSRSSTAISGSFGRSRNPQTFSSSARRARVSASVYEPSTGHSGDYDDDSFAGRERNDVADEADAFRRRIEALKQDMGDGWLKIFSQTQMKTPSPS
ncbi:L domain-like protein [Lentinula guzmanii]|uniref:L domain-like protein n=1 Tax=Lentinula guzmanii TaxID=2804957 RepID=A0AA38JBZ9_9AGAR|nr:L domain-like protein [Lentinula guzmanii]